MEYRLIEEYIENLTFRCKSDGGIETAEVIRRIRELSGMYARLYEARDSQIEDLLKEKGVLLKELGEKSALLCEHEAAFARLVAELEYEREKSAQLVALKEAAENRLSAIEAELQSLTCRGANVVPG